MKAIFLIFILVFSIQSSEAQNQNRSLKVCIAAFYNLENLFDTLNNPMVNDDDFTAHGIKKYTLQIYQDKLDKLAKVIAEIGRDQTPDGAAILGVAEIENDTVLNDLIHHPLLKKRNYQYVHFDSRDSRGIDVALLYNPKYLNIESSHKIGVSLSGKNPEKYATRDILWVKANLDGESIYILVNHWPSKRGGEDQTNASRNMAASFCRKEIEQIQLLNANAKIIVMGDFNDDPDSYSIQKVLHANGNLKKLKLGELYNPWSELYQKGWGSIANQDSWSLFDQILVSQPWLNNTQPGFYFYRNAIFIKGYMIENRGRYKGYPMRTWDGNHYRGGYSDHFPTYITLVKEQIKH